MTIGIFLSHLDTNQLHPRSCSEHYFFKSDAISMNRAVGTCEMTAKSVRGTDKSRLLTVASGGR